MLWLPQPEEAFATVLVKVQVCPPRLKAKLAVPLDAGVPVMV